MITIRSQLLVLLWLLLTALIALTAYWNYQNTREELLNFFDSKLVQTGLTLQALHTQFDISTTPSITLHSPLEVLVNQSRNRASDFNQILPHYFLTHQLVQVFQIWSPDKILIEKSKLAPTEPLTIYQPGLSAITIDNAHWRTFTLIDTDKMVYVVAEPADIRAMLVDNIALAQSIPMACLWLALLILGGFGIRWILKPLEKVSQEIAERHVNYLTPINEKNLPVEIRPIVTQFNHLLARVEEGIAREKRFTADASHELRTPLAALQIQAQVALDTNDSHVRDQALKKMMLGVQRCTHVIHQLSILAKIRPEEPLKDIVDIYLPSIATDVIAELIPAAIEKNIDIQFSPGNIAKKATIKGNLTLIRIMIRNIIDNAIRYSQPKKPIKVQIIAKEHEQTFRVEDQGPGIPPELRKRVFERFYRNLGHATPGSGLGLSIVEQIAMLHHAVIVLDTPSNGQGLCFDVTFPVSPP